MWSVPLPTLTARDSFRACVRGVKNQALRTRLDAVEPAVVESSNEYTTAATVSQLHTVVPSALVGGSVTTAEMSALYSGRMARRGSTARALYDELLMAPPHGRCPLCGQRTVSTLDHNLPKSRHPSLAVTPANLVPACVECNRAKGNHAPAASSQETIHPYFDYLDGAVWLRADVVAESPAAVTFSVATPAEWDPTLEARVNHHFELFKLATLYSAHAAEELLNIRYQLSRLHAVAGAGGVRAELQERARSYAEVRTNSWQVAMYRAVAGNDWFCGGGFAA